MSENEVLRRFPAHRLEGALRFSAHEVQVGTRAPDFALPDLGGKTVRLSGYRGKATVVLMFGSVTCGATATQLRTGKPSIRSLYSRYTKKGLSFSSSTPRNLILEKTMLNRLRSKSE
jgi:peroxiredoxin